MTTFSPLLLPKVLNETKTQTRRPKKENEWLSRYMTDRDPHWKACVLAGVVGPMKWGVGKRYAIQPGRGQKGVGHFEIVSLRTEDVRDISHEDAIAEGFASPLDFLAVWIGFYDKGIWLSRVEHPVREMQVGDWYMQSTQRGSKWHKDSVEEAFIWDVIASRPAELYQAWAITFKLVTVERQENAS